MIKLNSKFVDLSQTLSADSPSWDGDCGFNIETILDYNDCAGPDYFKVQKLTTKAGMGTHIDAPAHCYSGKTTVEQIKLESLISKCVVINVSEQASENYVILPEIITKFEAKNGIIEQDSFVIFHTGWSRFWGQADFYRNNLNFPSVHEDTAKLLLTRSISGLGTDTLSADAKGKSFPVHRAILGAGKYLVENIADASSLPETGASILVMPIKIQNATEAPIRLLALV